jgi:hypothetical protein
MSAELQSMLKFQAERMAAGRLSPEQFQELTRRYLELDRQAKVARIEPVIEPLRLHGLLKDMGEMNLSP